MFKRHLEYLGIIILLTVIPAQSQSQWIPFIKSDETRPSLLIQNSNNGLVSFSLQIKGMTSIDFLKDGQKYQRLNIPKTNRLRITGKPELPMITQLIAVPDCDDVTISVIPSNEIDFPDYYIHPAPTLRNIDNFDGNGNHETKEVFIRDESVYSTDSFFPNKYGEIIETGYIRSQKVVRVALYPIQFNPIRKHIKAVTNFKVDLTFINPTSPVNKELGIFRNMMHNISINYEPSGLSASIQDIDSSVTNIPQKANRVTSGSVNRVTNLSLLIGPSAMPCDYLIITHSSLFNSVSLTALANQRMTRNGFDVIIVKVDNDIYNAYNAGSPPNYTRIRNFISDIFLHGKANHTYDGKLGYFAIVGDANFDNATEMIPAAYPSYYGVLEQGGDYYYACTSGDSDHLMDLMYGRLSVGNEAELSSIVNKIITYESSSSGDWRNFKTFLAFSPDFFNLDADPSIKAITENIPSLSSYKGYAWRGYTGNSTTVTQANPIYGQTFSYADYANSGNQCGAKLMQQWLFSRINDIGQHTIIYEGHGRRASLGSNEGSGRNIFIADSLNFSLNNSQKYPFMIFNTCESGWFDANTPDSPWNSIDCIAEVSVNIPNKGAIACLASTRNSDTGAFGLVDGYVYDAMYNHSACILGEAVMESKLNIPHNQYRRQYNLYGDPALNLFPYGYTIPQNLSWSGTVDITTDITIPSGIKLTILPGTLIRFLGNYMLDVQDGGIIDAQGSPSNIIRFSSGIGSPPSRGSWKYLRIKGGNSIFKNCKFEYGIYPLYIYNATSGSPTVIENCTFSDNSNYGIRIYRSKANVKNCEIMNNGYYGVHCQYNPEVKFTGNRIHHNSRIGIYTLSSNLLKLYGNVIESNGVGDSTAHGMMTANSDVIRLGFPYNWYGKNTIRNNGGTELYAHSGNPDVDVCLSSIHDSNGREVFNNSGNQQLYILTSYFDANGCNYSGNVLNMSPYNSLPSWDGQVFNDFSIPKSSTAKDDPIEEDSEKIQRLKNVIIGNTESSEAESALYDLYSIVRSDFCNNQLGQKDDFYQFLAKIHQVHKGARIENIALRYMIIWKMLDCNWKEYFGLSKAALTELEGVDRMYVISDLGFACANAGWPDKAMQFYNMLKREYPEENEVIRLLGEDIKDVSWQKANGFIIPLKESLFLPASDDETSNILSVRLNNYPNPGNPTTKLLFSLPETMHIKLTIYNVIGQKVRIFLDEWKNAGNHTIIWDGRDEQRLEVPSGVYLLVLDGKNIHRSIKISLVK